LNAISDYAVKKSLGCDAKNDSLYLRQLIAQSRKVNLKKQTNMHNIK